MYNFPLYLLSFEYDTQDELIQLLVDSNTLQESDKKLLTNYQRLCKTLNSKPSKERLQVEFPTLQFNDLPLSPKNLDEQIRLDIQKQKDSKSSSELLQLASKIRTEGMSQDVVDKINSITESEHSVSNEYVDMLPNLKDIYDNSAKVEGIKTGVKRIDELTGGFQPGTFNCIAGFAGAGKTTFAVNVAYTALKQGKNVCYLTLEVPKVDMYYNFGSRHSFEPNFKKPISHSIVKKRELSKEDADFFFNEVLTDFQKTPGQLFILDETEIESYTFRSFEDKIRECDKLATDKTGHGIDVIFVDQAQLLKFSANMSSAGKETSVINLYVSFFRQQAINFLRQKRQCTVIMLSQINRDGWTRASKNGGRYTLTSLAEANELERASAMALAIFTDEGLKASKQAQVQLLKSRNGQTMLEPEITFMDPVYYVFGSDVDSSSSGMFGSTSLSDITAVGDMTTLDLNATNVINENNDLLSSILGG